MDATIPPTKAANKGAHSGQDGGPRTAPRLEPVIDTASMLPSFVTFRTNSSLLMRPLASSITLLLIVAATCTAIAGALERPEILHDLVVRGLQTSARSCCWWRR